MLTAYNAKEIAQKALMEKYEEQKEIIENLLKDVENKVIELAIKGEKQCCYHYPNVIIGNKFLITKFRNCLVNAGYSIIDLDKKFLIQWY